LGEFSGDVGPHPGFGAHVVGGKSLNLVGLLEHLTGDTGLPVIALGDDGALDVEELVFAGLVGHLNFVLWDKVWC
jgi:hypothetical protein